jgi:hypothetical protein
MQQVVIMPGGFHPFHAGHAALYQSARDAFPGADVYVAATNDTSTRPFPFQIKEKLAQLAGVDKGRFMQVKSPFQATEITAPYNAEDTQLIFVRSQKDADKPPRPGGVKKNGEPSYLQPYDKNSTAPMSQQGYMAYLPTVEFGPGMTSATEIRAAWPQLNEKRKTALVMSLYPKTQNNSKLATNVVKMLDTAIGTAVAENQGWAATYEADGLTAGTGVTGGMHASYQTRYNQPVDEAKLHFTDPSIRVNLYYVPPTLQRQGQVQNVAHNIPYATVQPLINRLIQKYPNMNLEYLVVGPTDKNQYGQRLREQEQLSGTIRAVPKGDSELDWDYYYKDQLIEPGTDIHSKVKDLHYTQKNPQYQQFKDAFSNPKPPGAVIPPNKWPENQPSQDRIVPDLSNPKGSDYTIPKQFIKDLDGNPVRLKDFVPGDPRISEDYVEERRSSIKLGRKK